MKTKPLASKRIAMVGKRTIVNLSNYQITTYKVTLVAEPADLSAFNEYRGHRLYSAEEVCKFAATLFPLLDLDQDREHFIVICLNNKNRFCGLKVVSTGSLTASLVHPRECFHAAIVLRAAGVVFLHNHPSGDPAPSPEDIDITKRLKEVGDVMGIRILDHVVVGAGRYFSFNEKGML